VLFRLATFSDFFKILKIKNNFSDQIKCLICNKSVTLNKMREHIGIHIISNEIVMNPHLCVFCGTVGCTIGLVRTNTTVIPDRPQSDCKYFVKFSMKAVEKTSKYSPCSNRPVRCEICQHIYWS